MRRKRVLTILSMLLAASLSIVWLGNVLAAATLTFNEGLTVSEAASGTITNSLLQADDPDVIGETLTYTLVTTPANGLLALNSVTLTPTAQFTQADIDNNLLVYTHDDSETLGDSFDFTVETITDTIAQTTFVITITPFFDQIPVVLDQIFEVPENSTTGLLVDTIVASDADAGDSLSYSIVGGNFGNPFAVGGGDGIVTVDSPTPLDFETNSSLTFTVQVEDLGTLTDTAVITVNVLNVNEAPTLADNTFPLAENSPNTTSVGTLLATDPDTGDTTFTYTITASDPIAAFAIGNSSGEITVTDTNQLNFETTPTFTLTVKVEDSGTLTDTAQVIINLTDANDPPVLSPAGPFSVPENSANSTPVGSPITATDEDLGAGDILTYTIIAGNSSGAFGIGASSGQIIVNDVTQLNFETTPTFTLTIEVEDSGTLTDTTQVIINLTDANDPPVLSPAGPFSVPENSANSTPVGSPITATDEDLGAGDILTYTITAGDSNGAFSIGASSGQIVVANGSLLNFDTPPTTYTLTVQVKDTPGAADTEQVVINLTNVNEAPTINSATFTIDENSPNTTHVDTITATDPEMDTLTFSILNGDPNNVFDIGSTSGQISVANSAFLDFEALGAPPHFSLTVQASDGVENGSAVITININDVNEVPTVNAATFSIQENSSIGTSIGTVVASDPEGSVTYEIISGNSSSAFAINSTSGEITVNNSNPLNFEVTPTFNLTVRVTDNGTPTLPAQTNTAPITINLTNRNEMPTVSDATFFISEDSSNGAVVGTVSASDPDAGDSLTFSITGSGNVGAAFTINPSSGQITVNDSTKLDADTTPIYNITVQVLDSGNLPDTATITINVSALPIQYVYLPLLLDNYPPVEPNNNCSQAYSLGTGLDYEFTADDQEDWYSITLTSQRNISIILSSFEPASGQLILYGGNCSSGLTLLQNNGSASATKTINITLGAGKYYIRVYSSPITNTTYNLRVNFN